MDLKNFVDTPHWKRPEDADKTFLEVLRDDQTDGSERLLAVELAGDFIVINDKSLY